MYIFYLPDSIPLLFASILEFLGHPNGLWGQGGRIFCKQE